MGVGTSLVVFAVGAILRFATTIHTSGFNLHETGVILMIVGAVAFVLSIVFWSSWGGFGGSNRHRQTTVDSPSGITRTTTDEHVG